jgi:transcriptional regulator GlxA family with amidase domain
LTRELSLPAPGEGECLAFKGGLRNEILERCARGIAEELRQRGSGHKLILETLAMQLLVETLRSWPRDQVIIVAGDSTPRLPCRDFVRAYEFMRTCRKEAFRVEHLCSFLGTSEERFTRLFTASTNHTPASFYNRMLLERGREFLRDPALSIKEISYQLGFKTSSHFIVAFRREFSSAPQEYRRHSLVSHSMFS